MYQLLATIAALLPCRPAAGRRHLRRPAPNPTTSAHREAEAPAVPSTVEAYRRHPVPVVRGEDTALVRPCVLANEARREEARRQRARRRTLWLAVHGVDVGPRIIHGVEVAA